MRKTRLAAAFAAAGSALAVCAEGAKEAAPAAELPELPPIVVEACRTGHSAREMPMAVFVAGRDDAAACGAKDVASLIERTVPSLNVTRTGAGNPALAQISMRGWGENGFGRVLVCVDGRRLNCADMSAPLLTEASLLDVDRIEVLHGPQCVLHGDGASAGLVNIVTASGPRDDGLAHGRIEMHAGSRDTFGAGAALRGFDEKGGVLWSGSGAWEHSRGFRGNNNWHIWNAGGSVEKRWNEGTFVRVNPFWNFADYGLPGYLHEDEWKHHRRHTDTPSDRYRRETAGASATAEFAVTGSDILRMDASFSAGLMRTRSLFEGGYTDYDPANGYAPARVVYSDIFRQRYDIWRCDVSPMWKSVRDIFGMSGESVVGLAFSCDRLSGRNGDEAEYAPDFWGMSGRSSSKYDFNRTSAAAFAQETLDVSETVSLQAGGRFQRTWSENTSLLDRRRADGVYAADAAVLLRPADGMKGFLRASRYFRSPFLDENPYRDYRAQEILRPETGWIVDAGFDWILDGGFSVFGDVFWSRTSHEILYDKFVWGTNVNAPDDVVRKGFTAGAAWERKGVAGASFAWTCVESEFDGGVYGGKNVPMSPKSTFAASGRVWVADDLFVLGGWRFVSSRRAYSDFENSGSRLASFGTFHTGVCYEPKTGIASGLRFSVTVDNLFDRRYADCAVKGAGGETVFYPAAGRSVTVSVGWEF